MAAGLWTLNSWNPEAYSAWRPHFLVVQANTIGEINSALAGYDAAAGQAETARALMQSLQQRLDSARAQMRAGETDPLAHFDQAGRFLRLEREPARRRLHQRVEVTAVGQVERHTAESRYLHMEVEPHRERGHVTDRDRGRPPRLARHAAGDQAGARSSAGTDAHARPRALPSSRPVRSLRHRSVPH